MLASMGGWGWSATDDKTGRRSVWPIRRRGIIVPTPVRRLSTKYGVLRRKYWNPNQPAGRVEDPPPVVQQSHSGDDEK